MCQDQQLPRPMILAPIDRNLIHQEYVSRAGRLCLCFNKGHFVCALGLPLCGLLPLYSIHVHECMRRARGARPSPHSSSVCCVCWGGCIVMKILSFHFSEPIRDDPMHNRKFQQAISSTKPLALSAFMSIIVSIL